jgi:hypothetical protein
MKSRGRIQTNRDRTRIKQDTEIGMDILRIWASNRLKHRPYLFVHDAASVQAERLAQVVHAFFRSKQHLG